jgi:hypothetical protein
MILKPAILAICARGTAICPAPIINSVGGGNKG